MGAQAILLVLVVRVASSIPRIATPMTRVANRFRGCLTLLLLGSAALFCLLASRSAPAFVGTQQPARRRTCRAGLRALGLFFATQTGNTETVAGMIGEASGAEATDIGEVETEDLASYDGLIVGCPTWNTARTKCALAQPGTTYSRTSRVWTLRASPSLSSVVAIRLPTVTISVTASGAARHLQCCRRQDGRL